MIALFLFLLFLPTQLSYHFWPDYAFIYGVRIDYLAPAIYFTDLLLIPLFLSKNYFNSLFRILQKHKYLIFVSVLVLILNFFFSKSPILAFLKFLKYLEIILLIIYIKLNKSKVKQFFLTTLKYSAPLMLSLSLLQIITRASSNTLFYWLGERSFTITTPGISLVYLFNNVYLRPYATFSHPNSLAGFYLVTILIYISIIKKPNILLLTILFALVLLSFSLNAILALILIIIIYILNKVFKLNPKYLVILTMFSFTLISLILTIMSSVFLKLLDTSNLDYLYRLEFSYIAGYLFSQNPLIGIGLNNFIINLPQIFQVLSSVKSIRFNWWLQPVHNIYLLLLSEAGLLLYLIILISFYKNIIYKKISLIEILPLVAILFTGLFDHYWLTLQQNQLLLALSFGLIL